MFVMIGAKFSLFLLPILMWALIIVGDSRFLLASPLQSVLDRLLGVVAGAVEDISCEAWFLTDDATFQLIPTIFNDITRVFVGRYLYDHLEIFFISVTSWSRTLWSCSMPEFMPLDTGRFQRPLPVAMLFWIVS